MQKPGAEDEDRVARLRDRAERERRARIAAETILEDKSRELFDLNRRLEQLVRERTRVLDVMLENISQGIVMLGMDGAVRLTNCRAAELLEVAAGEEIAGLVADLTAAPLAFSDMARFESRRPSGRFVELICNRLPEGDLVVTVTDISESKAREAALKDASQAAEAANAAKSRFLSTMSHEMRTPLNGILGALDLLAELPNEPGQKFYVDMALQAGDALLSQINHVLDFAKLEAGKPELVAEPVSLRDVAKSVLDILSAQAIKRHTVLTLNVAPELPDRIVGDAGRLRQILLNLAGNAIKFTENGRIDVAIVCVGAPRAGNPVIEVAVTDTGPGIAAHHLDLLFRDFSMLDSGYARRAEGTGLGLAITKRLVEAMDGEIGVTSELGVGSRFWFRFAPAVASSCGASPAGRTTARQPVARSRLHVLVVDDNATNRIVAVRMLEAAGHTAEAASDALGGIAMLQASRYDCVLMDISMPGMDGIEAVRHIRALGPPNGHVPVVALTANAMAGDREQFLGAGMDDYLTKPLRRADLERVLASVTPRLDTSAAA